jgi:hypothetical protein
LAFAKKQRHGECLSFQSCQERTNRIQDLSSIRLHLAVTRLKYRVPVSGVKASLNALQLKAFSRCERAQELLVYEIVIASRCFTVGQGSDS